MLSIVLITLILWRIFWHGWGVGGLEGFFWVPFVYTSSVLFRSFFALFDQYIAFYRSKKKKKTKVKKNNSVVY